MKLFKQKFTSILLAAAFLLGAISTVNFALKTEAATLDSGSFTIVTPSDPLFSGINIAPGYLNAKTIQVTNTSTSAKDFSIALSNLSGELKDVLKIKAEVEGTLKWDKVLANIAVSPNNELVATVPGKQTVNVTFTAYLPTEVGNPYQAKSVSFDFVMGDSTIEYQEPVEPIIEPVGPTSETESTGGVTGGTTPLTFGGRSIGLAGPGGAGTEGQALAPVTEQPKETGQVLGQAETKGEEASNKIWCYWWLILLIILAVFLIVYGWLTYNKEIIFSWVWPILAGVLVYVIHLILHRYYTPVKWCHYSIWFYLGELTIYYILYSYFRNKALNKEEK